MPGDLGVGSLNSPLRLAVEPRREVVQAWTETRTTTSFVSRPTSGEECEAVVELARTRGLTVCARGAGYSYGDVILNDGHLVLDCSRMNRVLAWDEATGHITVEPGVTVGQILGLVLGSCWTLASCVGGMGVTVGGAVSNNVHGKDSWKVGNFGEQVVEVTLLIADGQRLRVTRADTELMRALISGMGLLGIILAVTLKLRQVPSPYVEVSTTPVRDLHESLDVMERARETSDFMIAWVDAFATQGGLGRGTVETARWIEGDRALDPARLQRSLTVPHMLFGVLPATMTWSLARPFFRPIMVKTANSAKYWKDRLRGSRRAVQIFSEFNFMLNRIPGWKELYRPYGYLEFQPIIPRSIGARGLATVLGMCQSHGAESLLCAVKPHRKDDYLLSYEGDGYSIGVDIALRGRSPGSVATLTRELYGYVTDIGGKTFLAKDEVLPKDLFERMYPGHAAFTQVKHGIDPDAVFASDMYRRLLA